MGIRNFSSLFMIFIIIMMVFGSQRLRTMGSDLAIAIRNFRKGLLDEDSTNKKEETNS